MKVLRSNFEKRIEFIQNRSIISKSYIDDVQEIIDEVKLKGDQALRNYTKKWDGCILDDFKVSQLEIQNAYDDVSKDLLDSIKLAMKNIEDFHKLGLRKDRFLVGDGFRVGELIRPIDKVGIYVPGGKAAYPSTVLMNAIPAKLAGVGKLVMVTPPDRDGHVNSLVLVAADLLGISEIYKIGGAQSIAALSYGTESIPKVYKIVGPGNAYVAAAKHILSYRTGIDMIAGPSEVLILADRLSNPEFIAADLIAQAEHDEEAAVMVITVDDKLEMPIKEALKRQIDKNPRKAIIQKSIDRYGSLFIVDSLEQMIDLANEIAPEHLQVMMDLEDGIIQSISAGAIFSGQYSPEALGDYIAGPNHTLPTNGTAKFSSPLSIDDFIKKTSFIEYDKEALMGVASAIESIADQEGLYGHKNSVSIRRSL